ncbi:signal peptidase I [Paenibacillus doosanensis]|uniref:Signal peptidase I n=1 Tax=Paenibacillus konkukensis TaxID=2020716 RepID=A0ABY4RKA7_9BACL|nr:MULTISPECIES: signal peptidase I [Paenibacillus]MCS7461594.1 signal peptidase I [Paenibacillus doosanensis]UQZ82018.1 Signal peptidase I T [Paenibacillus konkukensis]
MKNLGAEIRSWAGSIGAAIVCALLIGIFVIQPTKVMGHSMDPTLHDQQRIFISKLSHTFRYEPKYGDIVIIDSRVDRSRTLMDDIEEHPLISLFTGEGENEIIYVKRVIGKPGDALEFKDHKVYRNGEALDEPYLNETMNYSSNEKLVVPEGHIFVMGDNRNNSKDSRSIGFIPLDHVLGIKL